MRPIPRRIFHVLFTFAAALISSSLHAADYETTVLSYNPLAYWRFNETTASPIANTVTNHGAAGTNIIGYALGGALTGQPGIVGNCVRVINASGAVGDAPTRVDVPFDPSFNPEPPFSVEFWAKANSLGDDTNGLCALSSIDPYWFEGGNRSGFLFYLSSLGIYQFRVGGENSYTAVALAKNHVGAGTWSHIVGEFDGTNITIYLNGSLAGRGTTSSNPFKPNLFAPLRIGATSFSGASGPNWVSGAAGAVFADAGNRGFDGWIDEVAVYTNLLSAATISSHYQGGSPNAATYDSLIQASEPALYLNLDEPAYTAPDATTLPIAQNIGSLGSDADGTNGLGLLADQPGASYPGFGANNKSVFFSGEQGNVGIVNPGVFPSMTGTPITLMAWVKLAPQSWSWQGDIIAQGISSPSSVGAEDGFAENFLRVGDPLDWEGFGQPDTTYYEVGECPDAATSPAVAAIYPAPAGDVDNWVFIAGTWDGTNWNLYHNGVSVAQAPDKTGPVAVDSIADILPGGNSWSIGSRSSPDVYWGWWFGGYIDEPAIFNTALSAQQILGLYNSAEAPPQIESPPQAPTFPQTPVNTVYEGTDVNLSVVADGALPLAYEWLKNGQALSSTTTNLLLTDVATGDSGTYSVVVSNAYGAVTSAAPLTVIASAPVIYSQPASEARYAGRPFHFTVGANGSDPLTYNWQFGTTSVGGNSPTYTNIATPGVAGTYSVVINNTHGAVTSSNVVLSVITPEANSYVSTILADQPMAYYRLGETGGTVAHDFAGGLDGAYVGSLLFGQAGYSLIDTNTAVTFGGEDNYVSLPASIGFSGTNAAFTLEAWANGDIDQSDGAPILAKGTGANGGNATEQFFIGLDGGEYVFFVRAPNGAQVEAAADFSPDGAWHYLAGTYDSTNGLNFYIDGLLAASASPPATGIKTSSSIVSLGAERSGVSPEFDLSYNGTIDEVGIYNRALTANQVYIHYAAAYGSNYPPFLARQPVSVTNYIGLPATLEADAGGTVPLNYQWYQAGVGAVGSGGNTYTVNNLSMSDAGSYYVTVVNPVGSVTSSIVTITVLSTPAAPPPTPGLVLHLPFDGDLLDKTGRGNNGTAVGITVINGLTNFGVSGVSFAPGPFANHQALYYDTQGDDTNNLSFNFVTLGNRPDLQFGTAEDFTVAFWIKLDQGYDGGDLPFFSDATNSTGGFGFNFAPSYGIDGTLATNQGSAWNGAWGVSLYDDSGDGVRYYGDQFYTPINDGLWHYLVHVFDRSANLVTYLDGAPALQYRQEGNSINAVGNLDSAAVANIGQDPTGTYRETCEAWIAELGVWNRALTPLEAAGLYEAGVNSNFFYVNTPMTFTATNSATNTLIMNFNGGVLESSTNVADGYSEVTGKSPYVVSTTNAAAQFFRVKF